MTDTRLHAALDVARSRRKSFSHARLRVTPAVHQELAEDVCAGTNLNPLGITVNSLRGVRVEIDADTPDPGWLVEMWWAPGVVPSVTFPGV